MSRRRRRQGKDPQQKGPSTATLERRRQAEVALAGGDRLVAVEETVEYAQYQQSSGPIPSADELEKYEKLLSGAAERIMTQWEGETAHRRSFENRQLEAGIQLAEEERKIWRRGQEFALIISLAALAGAVYLGAVGQAVASGLIGVGAIAGIVTAFVYGSRPDSQTPSSNNSGESSS